MLLKEQKGMVLLPVLLVVTALLVSTAFLVFIAGYKTQNVAREQKLMQAFYAAEAGLEIIKANVLQQQTWYNNLPTVFTDNDANYIDIIPVTKITEDTCFTVAAYKRKQEVGISLVLKSVGVCTATNDKVIARQTLLAKLGVFATQDYFKGVVLLPAQPATSVMTGSMQIKGPLVVDGKVNLFTNIAVNGNICASGQINGFFNGQPRPNYLYIPPRPILNDNYYLEQAMKNNQVWETSAIFGGSAKPPENETSAPVYYYHGFYFVHGDINIGGYYQGQGVLFCTGEINIMDDLVPGDGAHIEMSGNSLTLVAKGNVNTNQHLVYANVLTTGQLRALPGAAWHGAVCAAGIVVADQGNGGSLSLQHEANLAVPDQVLEGLAVKVVDWQEVYPVF